LEAELIKAGIVGVTGYTGRELVRILSNHDEVDISYLGSRRDPQPLLSEVFPALAGIHDGRCEPISVDALDGRVDIVFSCLPHGHAMNFVAEAVSRGIKVVDLSADYRLDNQNLYERVYKTDHTDGARLGKVPYGLPELFREGLEGAQLVTNPGCYPTASLLAMAPVVKSGLVDSSKVIIDAKSGVSGAGRKPNERCHFPECNEAMSPYAVGNHRHTPEIALYANRLGLDSPDVIFTPQLAPMTRGMLVSVYLSLKDGVDFDMVYDAFRREYRDEPFVRLREPGEFPSTAHTVDTNFCDVGVSVQGSTCLVVSAIDNLVKGASGQAVQNMNAVFGLNETIGLLPRHSASGSMS
jgi:N-acetyl-gamma-glutamyl-phosphate reductase